MTETEKNAEESGGQAFTQRQEDVLLELFCELSVDDRKAVIRYCRDLAKAAQG